MLVFVTLILAATSVATAARPVERNTAVTFREWSAVKPATGQCTIQLNYQGCVTCCDTSLRIGGLLVSFCDAATTGSGALLGGWPGSVAGGLFGDLLCEPMMKDANCYDRCIGKDGDPAPISCFDSGDPEEGGVCRQVCEQGQNNIGPGNCPANSRIALSCCVREYDPPEDCPTQLCPGPLCPPECDSTL